MFHVNKATLVAFPEKVEVSKISLGLDHCAAITSFYKLSRLIVLAEGELYSWGWGESGQLGNGLEKSNVPAPVDIFEDVVTTPKSATAPTNPTFSSSPRTSIDVNPTAPKKKLTFLSVACGDKFSLYLTCNPSHHE